MILKNMISIPDYIKKQQNEIGFGVYEYIDFTELQKTIVRDYTDIIVRYNILFLVSSIVGGLIGYIEGFLVVIGVLYILLLIYIFIKLIWRIRLFVSLNKIIVTEKGIIAGETIFDFNDKNLNSYLRYFENEFNEFLFKPSNLDVILEKNKQKIYKNLEKNFKYLVNISSNVRGADELKGMFFIGILMVLYSVSVLFFYYLGYVFVYIFAKIIIFFIKLYLNIFGNIEFKIHKESLNIYENLNRLKLLNTLIKEKFNDFSGGEIFNLGKFIDDKFQDFYATIVNIYKKKEQVYKTMEQSKYKDYIDFARLKKFIKEKFNEPVLGMIKILNDYISKLKVQIEEIDNLIKNTTKPEYIGNLKMKKLTLSNQLELMQNNKNKLEKMIL